MPGIVLAKAPYLRARPRSSPLEGRLPLALTRQLCLGGLHQLQLALLGLDLLAQRLLLPLRARPLLHEPLKLPLQLRLQLA
jgi:hypothetical protein